MKITLRLKNPQLIKSSVYTQFKISGQKFKFYTNKTVITKYWSDSKETVLSGHKKYEEINSYLKDWKRKLEEVIEDFQSKNITLESGAIKDAHQKKLVKDDIKAVTIQGEEIGDFMSYITNHIKTKKGITEDSRRVLKNARTNIILAFKLASKKDWEYYRRLTKSGKSKHELKASKTIPFSEVNLNWLKQYENYLHTHTFLDAKSGKMVHYKQNYISKQLKIARQFKDAAVEEGFLTDFKSKSIKTHWNDVDNVYTNFKELQSFLNLKFVDESSIEITRDKYVFNCYLGLRYSDLNDIKPHYFTKELINGDERIVYSDMNQKTKKKIRFVIHPTAVEILKKYNFNLPRQVEKVYNENLKIVALRAGLIELETIHENRAGEQIELRIPKWQLISSHTGRRSFCTNLYIKAVPIQSIMSVSGHRSEAEFMRYIHKDATINVDIVAKYICGIEHLEVR